MKTSHGVIQGYAGVAVVDGKHQVVVHSEAFGAGQEHELLEPMIEGTRTNFTAIGNKSAIFKDAKVTADSGFHNRAAGDELLGGAHAKARKGRKRHAWKVVNCKAEFWNFVACYPGICRVLAWNEQY